MTQSANSSNTPNSPLDAAQKIVAELQGMKQEDQQLAIQFATQTLRLVGFTPPASQQSPSIAPTQTPSIPVPSAGRSTDIKSFTDTKSPKTDTQFTAVVAYYYQFEAPPDARKSEIDVEVMKEAARQARRHQRKWIFTLTNAKNAGYLDSAGGGKFKLNAVGENLVAITLPGNGASSAVNGGGTAKKKASGKKASKKSG